MLFVPERPTKAIILGADLPVGSDGGPCGLVDLGGKPLIEHQIEALELAGIQDIIVVGDAERNDLPCRATRHPSVRLVFNPFSRQSGTLGSLWVARDELDRNILLVDGGILPSADVVEAMTRGGMPIAVAVSKCCSDLEGDVEVEGGRICAAAKAVGAGRADARAIGLLALQGPGVALVRESLSAVLAKPGQLSKGILGIVSNLIDLLPVGFVALDGLHWMEVGPMPWRFRGEPPSVPVDLPGNETVAWP